MMIFYGILASYILFCFNCVLVIMVKLHEICCWISWGISQHFYIGMISYPQITYFCRSSNRRILWQNMKNYKKDTVFNCQESRSLGNRILPIDSLRSLKHLLWMHILSFHWAMVLLILLTGHQEPEISFTGNTIQPKPQSQFWNVEQKFSFVSSFFSRKKLVFPWLLFESLSFLVTHLYQK